MKKFSIGLFVLLSIFGWQMAFGQNIGSLKTVVSPGFAFTMDLLPGYTDQDVVELQRVLNADIDTIVAYSGDGSRGQETKYFGDKTKQAVILFQEKYRDMILTPQGLSHGTGIVDKQTRTRLNLLIGVIDTYDSVGSPESRGGSGGSSVKSGGSSSSITVPVPTVSVSQPVVANSVCELVNILVDIDVIDNSLRQKALSAVGCLVADMGSLPRVSVYANDKSGKLDIPSARSVKISWESDDADECYNASNSRDQKSLSGSKTVSVDSDSRYGVTCKNKFGTDTDYVVVNLTNDNSDMSTTTVSDVSGSCSATAVNLGSATTWRVSASGGYGANTYSYAYSYVDNSGLATTTITRNNYFPYTYNTTGNKSMSVTVSSQDLTKRIVCTNAVVNPIPTYGSISYSTSTNRVLSSTGSYSEMVSVKQSSSLNTTNKLTLEAWVKPSDWSTETDSVSQNTDNVIISKGDLGKDSLEYALVLNQGKLLYHNKDSAIWTCENVVPLDEWTHVAVSIDEQANRTDLYVNGSKITKVCQGKHGLFAGSSFIKNKAITEYTKSTETTTASSTSYSSYSQNTSPKNLHIANYYVAACSAEPGTSGFIGNIDDVRVWNVARSDSDIKSFATSSVATTTGLVAEYNFDDYSVKDISKYANNGYQKGGIQVVEDKTSPSYVASSSASVYSSYSYGTSSYLSDPDGACYVPPAEEMLPEEGGAGPERFFTFAGVVTKVEECNNKSMKLWKVEIEPCEDGDTVSTQDLTGISSYEGGYIAIREGYQKVPAVGMAIRGKAVDDMGLKCSNGGSRYIGTVTGSLASSPAQGCKKEAASEAIKTAKESGNLLGPVNTWEWVVTPIGVGHATVNFAEDTIKDIFSW